MTEYEEVIQENIWDFQELEKIIKISKNLMTNLDKNTDKLVEALNKNSKSATFLAWVWVWIWLIWTIATAIWTYYWYLSYIK